MWFQAQGELLDTHTPALFLTHIHQQWGCVQSLYRCSEHLKHTKCEIVKDYLMFGFLELIHLLNNNL